MYSSVSLSRHKVSDPTMQDDLTYENYLKLAEAIFTGGANLTGLYDLEESKKRMQEIDYMRARGLQTECEQIKVDISESREKPTRSTRVYVKNLITGEEKEYESMKQACKEHGLTYYQVYKKFKKSSSKKILHNRLLIKKIEDKRMIKWTDEELAFLIQSRPTMKWDDIALALDRTKGACFEKYKAIKKQGKFKYYLNLDIGA